MTAKTDYFAKSTLQGIPAHCPILNRCRRRQETIQLANNWPSGDNKLGPIKLKEPIVDVIGEGPGIIGGETAFGFSGQCPEVNLFETSVAMTGFSGQPTTNGNYDTYFTGSKYQITETGHYSQCAEYAASLPQTAVPKPTSWLARNYQWLVGSLIAIGAIAAGILKSR